MLMETVTGASYGAGAADCAASLALSAVTDAVNGYVDDLVDRNDCDPRVAAANHAERSADPHARPGTLPCLRMFTTAYGKTDETDVFGDGAPVEDEIGRRIAMAGFTIPRAFVSMDPWSGTLLVGMPAASRCLTGATSAATVCENMPTRGKRPTGVAKRPSASRWTMASRRVSSAAAATTSRRCSWTRPCSPMR